MTGGTKNKIESAKVMINDVNNYHEAYLKKYSDNDTAKFLIGHGMGALTAIFLGSK